MTLQNLGGTFLKDFKTKGTYQILSISNNRSRTVTRNRGSSKRSPAGGVSSRTGNPTGKTHGTTSVISKFNPVGSSSNPIKSKQPNLKLVSPLLSQKANPIQPTIATAPNTDEIPEKFNPQKTNLNPPTIATRPEINYQPIPQRYSDTILSQPASARAFGTPVVGTGTYKDGREIKTPIVGTERNVINRIMLEQQNARLANEQQRQRVNKIRGMNFGQEALGFSRNSTPEQINFGQSIDRTDRGDGRGMGVAGYINTQVDPVKNPTFTFGSSSFSSPSGSTIKTKKSTTRGLLKTPQGRQQLDSILAGAEQQTNIRQDIADRQVSLGLTPSQGYSSTVKGGVSAPTQTIKEFTRTDQFGNQQPIGQGIFGNINPTPQQSVKPQSNFNPFPFPLTASELPTKNVVGASLVGGGFGVVPIGASSFNVIGASNEQKLVSPKNNILLPSDDGYTDPLLNTPFGITINDPTWDDPNFMPQSIVNENDSEFSKVLKPIERGIGFGFIGLSRGMLDFGADIGNTLDIITSPLQVGLLELSGTDKATAEKLVSSPAFLRQPVGNDAVIGDNNDGSVISQFSVNSGLVNQQEQNRSVSILDTAINRSTLPPDEAKLDIQAFDEQWKRNPVIASVQLPTEFVGGGIEVIGAKAGIIGLGKVIKDPTIVTKSIDRFGSFITDSNNYKLVREFGDDVTSKITNPLFGKFNQLPHQKSKTAIVDAITQKGKNMQEAQQYVIKIVDNLPNNGKNLSKKQAEYIVKFYQANKLSLKDAGLQGLLKTERGARGSEKTVVVKSVKDNVNLEHIKNAMNKKIDNYDSQLSNLKVRQNAIKENEAFTQFSTKKSMGDMVNQEVQEVIATGSYGKTVAFPDGSIMTLKKPNLTDKSPEKLADEVISKQVPFGLLPTDGTSLAVSKSVTNILADDLVSGASKLSPEDVQYLIKTDATSFAQIKNAVINRLDDGDLFKTTTKNNIADDLIGGNAKTDSRTSFEKITDRIMGQGDNTKKGKSTSKSTGKKDDPMDTFVKTSDEKSSTSLILKNTDETNNAKKGTSGSNPKKPSNTSKPSKSGKKKGALFGSGVGASLVGGLTINSALQDGQIVMPDLKSRFGSDIIVDRDNKLENEQIVLPIITPLPDTDTKQNQKQKQNTPFLFPFPNPQKQTTPPKQTIPPIGLLQFEENPPVNFGNPKFIFPFGSGSAGQGGGDFGGDNKFYRVFAIAEQPFGGTTIPLGGFVDSNRPIDKISDVLTTEEISRENRISSNPLRPPKNIVDEDTFANDIFGFSEPKHKKGKKNRNYDIFSF